MKDIKDITDKQKLYILFGIVGIVGLIFYYNILLRPQFLKFLVMNREFYAYKTRVRDAENLISNKDRLIQQYGNLQRQSESVSRKLPSQDEISSLLEGFSGIADSSRVKILKIKPLEALEDTSKDALKTDVVHSEFPIIIEARAGYHQCGTFINKLENMDRFIKIDEIDIRSRSKDLVHHDISLRVSTYVMR